MEEALAEVKAAKVDRAAQEATAADLVAVRAVVRPQPAKVDRAEDPCC
jgi:hypothetical protein